VKKEKINYFINNQRTSKSSMESISSSHIRHLSLKDYSDFDPMSLIGLLDERITLFNPEHRNRLQEHKAKFLEYKKFTMNSKLLRNRKRSSRN